MDRPESRDATALRLAAVLKRVRPELDLYAGDHEQRAVAREAEVSSAGREVVPLDSSEPTRRKQRIGAPPGQRRQLSSRSETLQRKQRRAQLLERAEVELIRMVRARTFEEVVGELLVHDDRLHTPR